MGPGHVPAPIQASKERGAQIGPRFAQGRETDHFYDFDESLRLFGSARGFAEENQALAVNPTVTPGRFRGGLKGFDTHLKTASFEQEEKLREEVAHSWIMGAVGDGRESC